MAVRWFVGRVHPGKETRAKWVLDSKKVENYLPQFFTKSTDKSGVAWMPRPLMVGYIFIQVDITNESEWANAVGDRKDPCNPIAGLLPSSARPIAVPNSTIAGIRAREDAARTIQLSADERNWLHQVGKHLRIIAGPRAGQSGFCIQANSQKVKVLMSWFGRAIETDVDQSCIDQQNMDDAPNENLLDFENSMEYKSQNRRKRRLTA